MSRPLDEMTLRDAREVLGVSSASTAAEIRRAFRAAARRAHPDTGGDAGAFHQVVDAYNRLQAPEPLTAAPGRPRANATPDLEIPPRVAIEGGDVDHRLPDGAMIRITLPPGLRAGDRVVAGQSELCVYIRAEDGVIVRGDDVWLTARVAPGLLKKGGRLQLETPLGPRSIWVDARAAERGLVRIEGEGLPARGRRNRGHLFVRLSAAPGLADSAALALLRRFAAAWAT